MVGKKIAAVFGGIRDDLVHLEEFFPGNQVGDQGDLVERFIVGRFRFDPRGNHGIEGQLDSGFYHGRHEHPMVKMFLFRDGHGAGGGLFEGRFTGFMAPFQQVFIVLAPILHHGGGEGSLHDIVHVFLIEGCHNFF